MIELKHKLTNDILFKMMFIYNQDLLKQLVASLLNLDYRTLKHFTVTNQEIPPEEIGQKFCRLDINMNVNGNFINLEIQVRDEGNYPERSLYYMARVLSSNLSTGEDFKEIPQVIMINILDFSLFPNQSRIHSEFQMLEVTSHEPLTDKAAIHFFELPKLTKEIIYDSGQQIWLRLINAKTEEDLAAIEALGVPIMKKAIKAYRRVSTSPEYAEIKRLREKAGHDEAQAISNAERKRDNYWQNIVADLNAEKDSTIATQAALIAELK
ncbi:MAG: Rpn family recombination-promoting nuclease/putative transposase [Oscillospiraceae bacterium]|nr:Rpn family recombination-promoting nuclease/putative transposase [Oscillospiraceae bacterium]